MAGTPKYRAERLDDRLLATWNEMVGDEVPDDAGYSQLVVESMDSTECLHGDFVSGCRRCLAVVANHSSDDDFTTEAVRLLNQGNRAARRAKPSQRRSKSRFVQASPEEFRAAKAAYEAGTIPEGWEEVTSRNGFPYIRKLRSGAESPAPAPSEPTKAKGEAKASPAPRRRRVSKETQEAAPLDKASKSVIDALRSQADLLSKLVELAQAGALDDEGLLEQAEALGIKGFTPAGNRLAAELDAKPKGKRPKDAPLTTQEAIEQGSYDPDKAAEILGGKFNVKRS